jgi:hypothetical protein
MCVLRSSQYYTDREASSFSQARFFYLKND